MRPKFVYVVDAGDRVKIGISTDPKRRLAGLSSGSSVKLTVAFALPCPDASIVERACHRRLAQFRMNSEWFECSAAFAARMVTAVASGDLAEAERLSAEWRHYLSAYKDWRPANYRLRHDAVLRALDAGLLSGPYLVDAQYSNGIRKMAAEESAQQADKARTGAERCETL